MKKLYYGLLIIGALIGSPLRLCEAAAPEKEKKEEVLSIHQDDWQQLYSLPPFKTEELKSIYYGNYAMNKWIGKSLKLDQNRTTQPYDGKKLKRGTVLLVTLGKGDIFGVVLNGNDAETLIQLSQIEKDGDVIVRKIANKNLGSYILQQGWNFFF